MMHTVRQRKGSLAPR